MYTCIVKRGRSEIRNTNLSMVRIIDLIIQDNFQHLLCKQCGQPRPIWFFTANNVLEIMTQNIMQRLNNIIQPYSDLLGNGEWPQLING